MEKIEIDGSAKSGSGTILRYAMALSSLFGKELHITNIRARRDKPGLRPQHLASVKACARLCDAKVEGASVNSKELRYRPGGRIKGGSYQFDIGTAGSTTMLAQALLPLVVFADGDSVFRISGGLFQDFAPSAHHMQHVLFPTLEKMGVKTQMKVIRPGYVPRGEGIIEIGISPVGTSLRPLQLSEQGKVKSISGIALSSRLKERKVSQRMVEECNKVLLEKGYRADIDVSYDETALSAGASLAIWAETGNGCLLGSDQAGKRGRSSEEIGRHVARSLLEDLETGATVDRYLADQLIIYAALAGGTTEYVIPHVTEHVDTNLWLIAKFGARFSLKENNLRVEGTGYTRA
ncbi:MAG: RNA 3'-terminal phosphate cyclase [Dehalococcoidales bacterium]|nr:RNA 3'-terminal phosphate cyclase [Dehalococcoidales bacterium]